ncbi:MAG: symmetrical bis(5'-nucleosyl)-tetraphosphatase [Gammaproteobacteria bacterium]|nr:symmetrical bis(5'-nucleosyl)-tetraphosphatase [Gammaproteobacteria bacterium]MDE2261668.1 symmetrical bis(5'-nucleosyl)-tetraphosphatase [Gammaproteobacteria bacterium]
MSRHAIGDIQGCCDELRALLTRIGFSADRDRLWFVGDLVNRGPRSLEVLRYVRALADNAIVVLGNHDLHLLAVACGCSAARRSDTLDEILRAHDRDSLLEWLATRPLAHFEAGDLLVHAGLVPQWTVETTLGLAREVELALRNDPRNLFDHMYGDEPDRWSADLAGTDRLRFAINVLTRVRVCTNDGRINLRLKGKPPAAGSEWLPWFDIESRRTRGNRVIFGHWSALGLIVRDDVIGLDSGCVWGGALTALDLDGPRSARGATISIPCNGYQSPDE